MTEIALKFRLTEIQEDILEMAAGAEIGPVVPPDVLAEPTLGRLIELGLLEVVHRRVEITDLGRAYVELMRRARKSIVRQDELLAA